MRVSARAAVLATAICLISGCMPWEKKQASWEGLFRPLMLSDYEDFRGHRDLTDNGIIVASYRIPAATNPEQVVSRARRSIVAQFSCYSVIVETNSQLELRCQDRTRRYRGMWEDVRLLVDPVSHRVYMMVVADMPSDAGLLRQLDTMLTDTRTWYSRDHSS